MFLEIEDFCSAVLATSPSVALMSWQRRSALASALRRIGPALRKASPGTVVTLLNAEDCVAESFAERLVSVLMKRDISKTCLVIWGLEPLVSAAAKILNGFRERLASAKSVLIVIREDRRRDFMIDSPDLMDWIGLLVSRAEDLGKPFTQLEVRKLLEAFETRNALSSKDFLEELRTGNAGHVPDGWLWRELLYVEQDLSKQRGQQ